MCWSQQQQIPQKSSSKKNPTEESVVSNNDHVGYEVDNTHEPASEQWGDSEVNATMSNIMHLTQDGGVIKNHHLGYEEHVGGLGS